MGDSGVFIEILMPFHRVDRYLIDAIKSTKLNSKLEIRLLLVNDSGYRVDASDLGLGLKDRILTTEFRGYTNALSVAVSNSTGDYVAFLDSDDLMHPERLDSQLELMIKDDLQLVSCGMQKVSSEGRVSKINSILGEVPNPIDRRDLWLIGSHGADSSLIVRGELLRNSWHTHKTFDASLADFGWALTLPKNIRIGHLSERYYFYRSHGDQISLKPVLGKGWDSIFPLWLQNLKTQFPNLRSTKFLTKNIGLALAFPAAMPKLTKSERKLLTNLVDELLGILILRKPDEFNAWKLTLSRRALLATRGRKVQYWGCFPGLLFSILKIKTSGARLRKID